MMRLRLHTRPSVLFAGIVAFALVVFLPLRVALGWAGLADYGISAERVTGTIWGGTVTGVQIGAIDLGTVRAALAPAALLTGRMRIVVDTPGGDIHGAIASSRGGFFLDDVTAAVPAGRAFAPLPVTRVAFEGVTVHFAEGRCDVAMGRVRAFLGGTLAGVALPAEVAGTARCEAGAVLIPLASVAGSEAITVRLEGSGRYRAELRLATSDPAAAERLAAAGFSPGADGYRLAVDGSL